MPTTTEPNPYLIGLDLETTGLAPQTHRILELGLVILKGPDLEIQDQRKWVVSCSATDLETLCDGTVKDMHKKSGLWDECILSPFSLRSVEDSALAFLGHLPAPLVMFGAGIVNFDRPFLRTHMPRLHDCFHYRSADVSTFRVFLPLWGIPVPEKAEKHRTIEDIYDAINLANYSRNLLRP